MKLSGFALTVITIFFLALTPGWAQEESGKIVITAEEIEKMNVLKIADLLNQIPGVKAGESYVSMRGSYKVKVFLDGRPINDPTSSHGGVRWAMVSLKNVEKIEIYKGKGGVEFGDDSSGGVIVITTKKIEAFHGNLEVYRGNLGTQNYSLNCQGDKGPFGVGVSSLYESTDGFRINNDKEKWRVGAKIQYALDLNCNFTLSGDFLREKRGLPGLPEFPTPNSRKDHKMSSYLFLARFKDAKSKTYLNEAETQNRDPDKNLDALIRVRKIGEDVATKLPLGKWGSLNCGAGFEWARAQGNQFDPQEEDKYWFFASKGFPLKSLPLTFTCGLRADFYSEYEETLNPEFKICFEKDSYALQFSANRTNNTPSFRQRYNETSSTKPNPNLTMEKAENYNISLFPQLNSSISGSVATFYSRITDRITYVRGDDGIGRYENFGEVTYKGSEISLDWKVVDVLSIKSSYTYLEAKDEKTGNWLPAKAKHRVNTDLIYTPTNKLSMILNTKYVSRQYTRSDNKESVPEYFVGDFRSEYNFKGVGVFCEIKNIFDKDYFYGDGYPAPPRTWIIGMNLQL